MSLSIITIDIGNTHTDSAVWDGQQFHLQKKIVTTELIGQLPTLLASCRQQYQITAVVFCSVVPAANESIIRIINHEGLLCEQLTYANFPLPISYPNPPEVGQDRLANAVGAWHHYGQNAVIIDFGTATNFDVLRQDRGYEGGILTPGLATMTEYLHEKTALLPRIALDDLYTDALIGKSTYQAMQIGAFQGYLGMIEHLLQRLTKEHFSGLSPQYILTGGAASQFANSLSITAHLDPLITMKGLLAFYQGKQS